VIARSNPPEVLRLGELLNYRVAAYVKMGKTCNSELISQSVPDLYVWLYICGNTKS
jgi:hypothetical protein